MILNGIGVSAGVSIGKVFIKKQQEENIYKYTIVDKEKEIERFERAKESALKELDILYKKALETIGEEEAQIFDMHKMLMEDQDYIDTIISAINDESVNAEYAVSVAQDLFIKTFESMDNAYMQERVVDIKDISTRLIDNLIGKEEEKVPYNEQPVIIVAKDLLPSDTIQMDKQYLLGFITECGGKMSHSAILARTMQIPAVVGAAHALEELKTGDAVILDGESGNIYVNPTEEEIAFWSKKREEYIKKRQDLKSLIGTKSITKDGKIVEINANIGSPEDMPMVLENDAEGVGLFRSEFLYMNSNTVPSEEQQYEAYKKVLEDMGNKRVIIRTLDVGGDKEIPYLNIEKEENPFLGYRAIRVCLDQTTIFRTQLRALLRASIYGKLGIMFPMIVSISEITRIKEILQALKEELVKEGEDFSDDIEIGIMIETPAAVVIADLLAKEVDFFSIGTNDLTQYMLAVDRMNTKIATMYDTHHPAVLRAIKMVADYAHEAGIWVGICGEAAADTTLTETFLAIGIDELSVAPGAVLELRREIQNSDVSKAIRSIML